MEDAKKERKGSHQHLQVLVTDFKHISDIEGPVLGTAGLLHELCVDVPSRGHDHYDVLPLLVEQESDISDFGTRQEEVESWTQGIY